jgi:hypothetical protein
MPIEWSPYPASLGHHPALFWHFARAYFRRIADRLRMALPYRQVSEKSEVRTRSQGFLLTMGRVVFLTARMACSATHVFSGMSGQVPCLTAWWTMDAEAQHYATEPGSLNPASAYTLLI